MDVDEFSGTQTIEISRQFQTNTLHENHGWIILHAHELNFSENIIFV